jgi:hypothetical protein
MSLTNFDFSIIEKRPIDALGFFGPGILFIESIARLWNQRCYLFGYLIAFFLNYPINQTLKNWIKQPRPSGGRSLIGEEYNGADHYGMPSLHAQSTAISIMFLYLVKGFSMWVLFEIFIMVLVVYQRLEYKRHTFEQLMAGLATGCFVGWCGWFLTNTVLYRNSFL